MVDSNSPQKFKRALSGRVTKTNSPPICKVNKLTCKRARLAAMDAKLAHEATTDLGSFTECLPFLNVSAGRGPEPYSHCWMKVPSCDSPSVSIKWCVPPSCHDCEPCPPDQRTWVKRGLRTTLLTQAKRLEKLAEARVNDFPEGLEDPDECQN
jgi:hypothetical protein